MSRDYSYLPDANPKNPSPPASNEMMVFGFDNHQGPTIKKPTINASFFSYTLDYNHRAEDGEDDNLTFLEAYNDFFYKRSEFYFEMFSKEDPFATYERLGFNHSTRDLPIVIMMQRNRPANGYDNDGDHYWDEYGEMLYAMRNFADVQKMDFTLATKHVNVTADDVRKRLPHTEILTGRNIPHDIKAYAMPHLIRSKGTDITFSTHDFHQAKSFFYLLPEDYHFFKDVSPYFMENYYKHKHGLSDM